MADAIANSIFYLNLKRSLNKFQIAYRYYEFESNFIFIYKTII